MTPSVTQSKVDSFERDVIQVTVGRPPARRLLPPDRHSTECAGGSWTAGPRGPADIPAGSRGGVDGARGGASDDAAVCLASDDAVAPLA